jgi:DNA-binding YbaB/EbfC family protein
MANPLGPPPSGPPDFGQLMKQAQMLQAQMESAQQQLAEAEVEGSAGGGLVKAMVTGTGDILAVTIDPQVIDPADPDTLGDLVVAAVRAAQESAQLLQQKALGPLAGGGLPDLSALGL